MEYVRLGASGLKVSRIALGCFGFGSGQSWMLPEADSLPIFKEALDGGVNFFDTANNYSQGENEEIVGRALKSLGVAPHQVVVATKVYFPTGPGPNDRGLSRKHVLQSVDDSLRRLGADHIDLLNIHRFDEETPVEETLDVLGQLIRDGKVRHIGASSMAAWQFAKLLDTADRIGAPRFVSMQNNYSLAYREEEREMNPLCVDQGIGLTPWAPLGGGLLAGSRRAGTARQQKGASTSSERFQRPEDQAVADATFAVAEARGVSPAQVAIAWLLSKPGMAAPVVGATKPGQLRDLIGAVGLTLSPDEIARLEGPYVAQPPMSLTPPAHRIAPPARPILGQALAG